MRKQKPEPIPLTEQQMQTWRAFRTCNEQLEMWFNVPRGVFEHLIHAVARRDAPEVIAASFEQWVDPEAWAREQRGIAEWEAEEAEIKRVGLEVWKQARWEEEKAHWLDEKVMR
jgi:hypothetical protein